MSEEATIRRAKEQQNKFGYARILQETVFPDKEKITHFFPQSFIYHESKETLSGDFFWFDRKEDKTYFTCADCTGHGVAGALISFMAITMLNHLIIDDHIHNTADVLNKLNSTLYHALSKKFGKKTIFDGLEIGLVAYDEKNSRIEYAGAGCPLYHISGDTLKVYEGQHAPIGHYLEENFYRSCTIDVKPGDQLFLFSDGYADQFGAQTGKKFKYQQLRNLLTRITNQSIDIQQKIIKETFHSWRGDEEQTDDVTVISVRL